MIRRCLALLSLLPAALLAADLAPEVLRLARIRQHMETVLMRQPDYTCLETIERSRRAGRGRRFSLVDAIHLEVAVVSGKELFSWPGEREFKDRDLRELAPTGAIGNGSFAIHARAVFLSGIPDITYHGEELLDGRRVTRYDYNVPQNRSGYKLRVGEAQGIMGYRGSFWNDADSLDLVRLNIESTDIPPHVPIRSTRDSIEYRRVLIGENDFLLPASAEMVMEDFRENVSNNRITFSGCRKYAGESVLSFDEAPTASATPPPAPAVPVTAPRLPSGILVEIGLDSQLRFPGNAVGDPIRGVLRRPIKHHKRILIPKGATVTGNILLLERTRDERGRDTILVALSWREIAFDGKIVPFEGQLEDGGAIPVGDSVIRGALQRPKPLERGLQPHPDVFFVRKETLDLPRGLPMFWRTGSSGKQ